MYPTSTRSPMMKGTVAPVVAWLVLAMAVVAVDAVENVTEADRRIQFEAFKKNFSRLYRSPGEGDVVSL